VPIDFLTRFLSSFSVWRIVVIPQVEEWVVATISSQLLEAKMDQKAGVVMVSRANHRAFGLAEWQALQVKLHAWQANLKGILATISKATPSTA
jgi:hypothetical protein